MRTSRGGERFGLVAKARRPALAALLGTLALASPAAATTTTVFDVSSTSYSPAVLSITADPVTNRSLQQTATGQILGSPNLESMNVALECAAVAAPNPLAVGVTECYLLSPNGTRYNIPLHGALSGAADATASAVLNIPPEPYRVCMRSNAFFQDNYYLDAPAICTS